MEKREVIYRHSGTVRITHWINVLVLLVLLMSGMQIFNAHPALYLGAQSNFDAPILAMDAMQDGYEVTSLQEYAEARAVHRLGDDLASGRWAKRNRDLLDLEAAELGLRLLVA